MTTSEAVAAGEGETGAGDALGGGAAADMREGSELGEEVGKTGSGVYGPTLRLVQCEPQGEDYTSVDPRLQVASPGHPPGLHEFLPRGIACPSMTQPVDYDAAVHYLYDRINFERASDQPYRQQDFRLARMERLLVELGNPQQSAPVIHIAGSKGKGSVAWMMAEILRRSGLRTGLYTSPHLRHLEERFVVDAQPISHDDLAAAVAAVKPAVERLAAHGHGQTTFFELTTALAWWYFRQRQTDVNVIEVGLGGRLDCTNVCWPALCFITSISYDHQQQLGETLAEIAGEKAGILKPGVPVISGVREAEPAQTIEAVARARGCRLEVIEHDFAARSSPAAADDRAFDYHRRVDGQLRLGRERLRLGLLGPHQRQNAALVLAGVDRLQEQGWSISETAVREGLAAASVPGRVQIVGASPTIVLDTSHNPASIAALIATLDQHCRAAQRWIIFSVSRDKKFAAMLEPLRMACDRLILTQFQSNPRAASLEQLEEALAELPPPPPGTPRLAQVTSIATPLEALRFARAHAQPQDLIAIAGSFFLAGELMPHLNATNV